jgi:hypothetical protein
MHSLTILRLNIDRYRRLFESETDPDRCRQITMMLHESEAPRRSCSLCARQSLGRQLDPARLPRRRRCTGQGRFRTSEGLGGDQDGTLRDLHGAE